MTGRLFAPLLAAVCVLFLGLSGVIAAGIDAGAPGPDLQLAPLADVVPPSGVVIDDGSRDVSAVIEIAKMLVGAVRQKNWRVVMGLALSLLVFGLRRLAVPRLPWPRVKAFLLTDRGGVVLLLGTAVASALSTLLLSGVALSPDHLIDCLGSALTAAGGYSVLKKLWAPGDKVVDGGAALVVKKD